MIMGSHEPSVTLVYGYLKKWVRIDQHSVPNVSKLSHVNLLRGLLPEVQC